MEDFEITSSAFKDGSPIPPDYTCDGQNINPPLSIKNLPDGTKSLALIVYDPDVPTEIRDDNNWDHWVVFNIPPEKTEIQKNDPIKEGVHGINTSGNKTYGGPCPPKEFEPSQHRYIFKIYALDSALILNGDVSRIEVEKKIGNKILDSAKITGIYKRI